MPSSQLTFLDTSVIAHAAGNVGYAWAVTVLQRGLSRSVPFAADALSLQEAEEVLTDAAGAHKGRLATEMYHSAVTEVLPVTVEDFSRAREIARTNSNTSPRECLHAAVMQRNGIGVVCAVRETDYAGVAGLRHVTLPPPQADLA